MVQQYTEQQTPSIRVYNESTGVSSVIPYIEIQEITPETTMRLAKHVGESGKVFADTRVIMPARYRARIIVPEMSNEATDTAHAALMYLLDASYVGGEKETPCKFTVTSYFSRCFNMMVVMSRNRDTVDQVGVRIQEVVFEECLVMDGGSKEPQDFQDSASEEAPAQYMEDE